jgi:hypothetical protein
VRGAPAVRVQKVVRTRVVTTGPPEHPAFPAQWLYGLFRALPSDRAFLPPSPLRSLLLKDLNASVGASGPHGFAVRSNTVRRAPLARPTRPRPSHPIPNARDDRDTPLFRERDGAEYADDLGQTGSEIFFTRGLDRRVASGKSPPTLACRMRRRKRVRINSAIPIDGSTIKGARPLRA